MVKYATSEGGAASDKRRLLFIYETTSAREHAINSSRQLAELCSGDASPRVHWCPIENLADPTAAKAAADAAAALDLVVFAITPDGEFSSHLKHWMESWISKRRDADGAIIGLVMRQGLPCDVPCLKEMYLRHAAHRANMDYLSNVPPFLPEPMSESPDFYIKRAGEVTSVLDEILRSNWPPPTLPR